MIGDGGEKKEIIFRHSVTCFLFTRIRRDCDGKKKDAAATFTNDFDCTENLRLYFRFIALYLLYNKLQLLLIY